jgi:hypothetical protein
MFLIGVNRPALNAVIPTIGFNLSTWSLPFVKDCWLRLTNRVQASLEVNKTEEANDF